MLHKLLAAALFSLPVAASAATLDSDTVLFDLDPNEPARAYIVGDGLDGSIGFYILDFNEGANGDNFLWLSTRDNLSTGSNTTLALTDLDFSAGHVLIGFELFDTAFTNLTFSVSSASIIFSWDVQPTTNTGFVIYGKFLTAPTAIPLPATAPLILIGLSALATVRQRKSPAQNRAI